MKKLLTSLIVLGSLSVACFAADPAPAPAPEVQKPACCLKAEKEGKTCQNKCCIKAAKEGKVCEKCLKHSHHKKHEGEAAAESKGQEKHD